MYVLPVTDDSCISQQFKDPQQLQPEKIPPLSALLVLKAQTGFHFTAVENFNVLKETMSILHLNKKMLMLLFCLCWVMLG